MGEAIRLPQAFRLNISLFEAVRWSLLKVWLDSDLSVADLCAKSGLSRRVVREILTGRAEPTLRNMAYWAEACGADLDARIEPIADCYLPRPRPAPKAGGPSDG